MKSVFVLKPFLAKFKSINFCIIKNEVLFWNISKIKVRVRSKKNKEILYSETKILLSNFSQNYFRTTYFYPEPDILVKYFCVYFQTKSNKRYKITLTSWIKYWKAGSRGKFWRNGRVCCFRFRFPNMFFKKRQPKKFPRNLYFSWWINIGRRKEFNLRWIWAGRKYLEKGEKLF